MRARRDQPAPCGRVAAGKQRHVMSECDQLVDQPGDDALGTAVEFGRDTFGERGDLCDAHGMGCFRDEISLVLGAAFRR
jgi:hypothetical protein